MLLLLLRCLIPALLQQCPKLRCKLQLLNPRAANKSCTTSSSSGKAISWRTLLLLQVA
jgi:hypothetical protein